LNKRLEEIEKEKETIYKLLNKTYSRGRSSKPELEWLNHIENEYKVSLKRQYKIKNFIVDGYCSKNNTIYEYFGDYWHGNLNTFNENDIHPVKNISYKEINENTLERVKILKELGYNLVVMWEEE